MLSAPPCVLTIAGSDSSAGAGVQADLKTITALDCYGLTAVTCVVSEIPGKVSRIQPLDGEMVADQIRLLGEAFPIAAAKTGMIGGRAQMEAVIGAWRPLAVRGLPLVVDPVMIATSGARLLDEDAVQMMERELFPLARVITPNLDEARALFGGLIDSPEAMERAAHGLSQRHGCGVLLKGGHLGGEEARDVLVHEGGVTWFASPRVPAVRTHGTGCALSAAIACELAQGRTLVEAVGEAKAFISAAIVEHFRWSGGRGEIDALNHFATRRG